MLGITRRPDMVAFGRRLYLMRIKGRSLRVMFPRTGAQWYVARRGSGVRFYRQRPC